MTILWSNVTHEYVNNSNACNIKALFIYLFFYLKVYFMPKLSMRDFLSLDIFCKKLREIMIVLLKIIRKIYSQRYVSHKLCHP